MAANKIGLFGGTFDPIHIGHLMAAERIREDLGLSKILFIPSRDHPLKDNKNITVAKHRLAMLQAAVADNSSFEISTIELDRRGPSFTVDTVRALRSEYPQPGFELFFLMGSDNVNQLQLWKEPQELTKLCHLVAFGRAGFQIEPQGRAFLPKILFVDLPMIEISSTEIRRRIRENRSVRYLVPPAVEKYIRTHHLYAGGKS